MRHRRIAASPQRVWELIADPHHQPRWWPGVERVEGVEAARFTQVMRTERGRPVRIDFQILDARAPTAVAWRQEVAGTPFARVLAESVIELALAPAGEATVVTLTQTQKLRGSSRTGGFMLRRATGRRLDAALDGLAAVCEIPADRPPTGR